MTETDVERLARHTDRLVETASGIDDMSAASLCPGWSRGHVLSHLARNADAVGRLTTWALTGKETEMYPGGQAGRDADIEAGATRTPEELVTDLRDSAAALKGPIAVVAEQAVIPAIEMRGGRTVSPAQLPALRLREVIYHHIDLDAGFDFTDVEPDLITRFLADEVARLDALTERPAVTIITDTGDRYVVAGGGPEVSGTPAGLVRWLARRDPSGVSGEQIPELPQGI